MCDRLRRLISQRNPRNDTQSNDCTQYSEEEYISKPTDLLLLQCILKHVTVVSYIFEKHTQTTAELISNYNVLENDL